MMTLRRAIELCNGLDALGDTLNVSTDALERMLAGEEEIPQPLFVQAVGLILEAGATRPPKRTPDSHKGGRRRGH